MAIYFTDNQYLKTAEEDYEAAEIVFGHKYYDQTVTLCAVAMTKYLKAILESVLTKADAMPYYNTEDKHVILQKIKEVLPEVYLSDDDCRWMDNMYGKANCTDGFHIIMPKQTAVEALDLAHKARKYAKQIEKEHKAHEAEGSEK